MSDDNPQQVQASVTVPSADLINFRFDNNDKNLLELKRDTAAQFDQLNHKLDYMVTTFTTKSEALEQQTNNDKQFKALWTEIARIKAAARWWIATGITASAALAGMIYTLTHLHR